MFSYAVFVMAHILLDLTIRRRVKELEGNKLDHALSSEVLHGLWVRSLLLGQSEHGSVEQSVERIVVELANGHLASLFLVVLDELLKALEHLTWITTVHEVCVLVKE